MDAFNYNQWGLLEGKVIDIDRNITIQGEQAFFKVRSALNSTAMELKSGYKTQITKGMTKSKLAKELEITTHEKIILH